MEPGNFYDGIDGILRSLVTAPALYILVIAFIRISGKRSTSQMNNFDWVVTVAMGSLMASGILQKNISVAEAATAIAVLLALQWLLTKSVAHSATVARLVRARPALLFHNGSFCKDAMMRERVSEYEVLTAVRQNGVADLARVQSVILEADASLSVLMKSDEQPQDPAIQEVRGLSTDSLS